MQFIASIQCDENRREFCRDIELPAIPAKHDIIFVDALKMEVRDKQFYAGKSIKLLCNAHKLTTEKELKKAKWTLQS